RSRGAPGGTSGGGGTTSGCGPFAPGGTTSGATPSGGASSTSGSGGSSPQRTTESGGTNSFGTDSGGTGSASPTGTAPGSGTPSVTQTPPDGQALGLLPDSSGSVSGGRDSSGLTTHLSGLVIWTLVALVIGLVVGSRLTRPIRPRQGIDGDEPEFLYFG